MDNDIDVYSVISALQHLTAEELDRLRLRLLWRFGDYLLHIPDAPGPDDLLHEAIEDLLNDRRRCPLQRVDLVGCLYRIVSSKVSHLYEKWQREKIVKVPADILERKGAPVAEQEDLPELRAAILERIADDPLLVQIVEYRLEHPEEEPLRSQKIAEHLHIDVKDIYNANRRLKMRLKDLQP